MFKKSNILFQHYNNKDVLHHFVSLHSRFCTNSNNKKNKMMNEKMKALMIGVVGAGITLSAYSQTYMTPTQCIGTGLVVLIVGLFVGEGILPV
ncbi:hypothetical protein L2E82_19369 [Cichorium intybus]|uniref:Uncharacterized protein n=1 Tax=Cichorium intybus TaxID=13427 RepID=A0ACB9FB63_CICIN|nr:hypothetical protein L2E82_19369 [Cichorium intybus]